MKNTYLCPVCGYGMEDQPDDYNICPSCGVEFGYSDAGRTFDDLRAEWIRIGMPWHSRYYKSPRGWNPRLQLLQSGLEPIRFSGLADNELSPPSNVKIYDPMTTPVIQGWSFSAQSVG